MYWENFKLEVFCGVVVRASTFHAPLGLRVRFRFELVRMKRVNECFNLPKIIGFLQVLWVSPTGKVDRVG
jgi:hypothetical protein